ncbi:hypothetical protein ACH6EH_07180 [Paenibacillus sp. JSM ZJ436]|uniref:hypothetical protein n=1 Tax=Paenibacillus sp. JSM ZJ436 TaxID=3376190 RepID=UPI0037BADDE1
MWIVVYKQKYYPSVFDCSSEAEAKIIFDRIKEKELDDVNIHDGKLYMAKVEQFYGGLKGDVDWYLDIDVEEDHMQ